MPWVDDWQWIENLQTKKLSILDWLFKLENIHTTVTPKILLLISKKYLNFNFEIFNYLSLFLIYISALLVSIKLYKENFSVYFILLLIFILFTGKQMVNVSQMCNITWLICYFFIIVLWFNFNLNKVSLLIISIIFLSPLTLGYGYLVPGFVLIYSIMFNINYKSKYIYISVCLFSIFISYFLPRFYFPVDTAQALFTERILNIDFAIKFIFTYFSLLGSIFLPWIGKLSIVGFIFGIFQFLTILFIFIFTFSKQTKSFYKYLQIFINNNILLIFGLLFPLLVAFSRQEFYDVSIRPRYVSGVLLFQIGFFIYCYRYFINSNFHNLFLFYSTTITIIVFFVGLLTPYYGIHWQLVRSIKSNSITECFLNLNNQTDFENCTKYAYDTLFYSGEWYDYSTFQKQFIIFEQNNEIFFKDK